MYRLRYSPKITNKAVLLKNQQGLCGWSGCNKPKGKVACECDLHQLMRRAAVRLGSRKQYKDLLAVWTRQGGALNEDNSLSPAKCAYLQIEIPFHRASIDHINDDAGDEQSNLQWVLDEVNMMKKRFGHELFLALCHEVSAKNTMQNQRPDLMDLLRLNAN